MTKERGLVLYGNRWWQLQKFRGQILRIQLMMFDDDDDDRCVVGVRGDLRMTSDR
jgi:hypothetical protein